MMKYRQLVSLDSKLKNRLTKFLHSSCCFLSCLSFCSVYYRFFSLCRLLSSFPHYIFCFKSSYSFHWVFFVDNDVIPTDKLALTHKAWLNVISTRPLQCDELRCRCHSRLNLKQSEAHNVNVKTLRLTTKS